MREGRRGMYCFAPYGGWYDQQLTKNVGVVPYIFHKEYGFHSVMVTGRGGPYPSLNTYVKGLELARMESPEQEHLLDYMEKQAADMDVFVMHGPLPFYYALLERYRELRPDGKVYLELDPNGWWMNRIPPDQELFQRFLSQCDVIGVSCRRMQRYLSAKWPCRLDYLPNGYYDFAGGDIHVDFNGKENVILTVGRIGTAQKASQVLLEAFAAVAQALLGWRLRLIGNIDRAFERGYKKKYFERYPELRDCVEFTGPIQDKKRLMEEYRRAKIFALTSAMEGGTPNVVAEALYGGCYMITSDIDGASDVVDDGACGEIFPIGSTRALADILLRVCRDPKRLLAGGQRAEVYGRENFDFLKIAARLHYLLFDEPPRSRISGNGMGV